MYDVDDVKGLFPCYLPSTVYPNSNSGSARIKANEHRGLIRSQKKKVLHDSFSGQCLLSSLSRLFRHAPEDGVRILSRTPQAISIVTKELK